MRFPDRTIVMPGRLYADARPNLLCHRIIAHIAKHQSDNGWLPSAPAELARALGKARTTLIPWLQSLVEWGYLRRRGVGSTTAWRVVLDPTDEEVADAVLADGAEGVGISDTPAKLSVTPVEPSDTSPTPAGVGKFDKFNVKQQEVSGSSTGVGNPDTADHKEYNNLQTKGITDHPSTQDSDSGNQIISDLRERAQPTKAERCFAQAGPWLAHPSKVMGLLRSAIQHIRRWEQAGADFDEDILPVVIELTQQPPGYGEPIETFKYFDKAVRAAAAERMAPVKPITAEDVSRGTRGRARPERQHRDLDALAEAADAYAAQYLSGGG